MRVVVVMVMVMVMMVMGMVAGTYPSCYHDSCTDCIRSESCVWCKNEDFKGESRCKSKQSPDFINFQSNCSANDVYDLPSEKNILDNGPGGKVQLKPKKVALSQRPGETQTVEVTYTHLPNYPVDLYYLMDLSNSMADDKEKLSTLGNKIVSQMKNLTTEFMLGFGAFSDKTVLPYIETVDWSIIAEKCEDCTEPFSFKNILPLTKNAEEFNKKVEETQVTNNQDFPEGSLEGLMQAIVCRRDIKWRNNSLSLIVITTDAPFHIAGDGLLGGIVTPNDMECHLDVNGTYTHSDKLDYPSVGQISDKVEEHQMNLIFAVDKAQEPVYARLTELIPRTTYGILKSDSANIADLIVESATEIINSLTMKAEVPIHMKDEVQVTITAPGCSPKCTDLKPDQQIKFTVSVKVKKCPADPSQWKTSVVIYPDGRKMENMTIDLTLLCDCDCNHQDVIQNAEQCNTNGNLQCGVCKCSDGYLGEVCQCNEKNGAIDEDLCHSSNNSNIICSGQGTCECGKCHCNTDENPDKKITGTYCECTNYRGCTIDKLVCSGHGTCECDKCTCEAGWSDKFCDCHLDENNCVAPADAELCSDNDKCELCSGHGKCECNKCKCDYPYFAPYCDDCNENEENCTGKCKEYSSCVECLAYDSGSLQGSECDTQCQHINLEKVPNVDGLEGKYCSITRSDGCRFYFKHKSQGQGTGQVDVWAQEEVECQKNDTVLYVVFGILGAVVLIGLVTLIVWRILTYYRDKREVEKFLMEKNNAKFEEHENVIYKPATTEIQNPMFGRN